MPGISMSANPSPEPARAPDALGERLLKKARNAFQADVSLLEGASAGEAPRVRKDISGRPAWARATGAGWSMRREAEALRALEGLNIAPRLLAWDGSRVLEMEFVAGERLPKRRDPVQPGPELFERLQTMLASMHQAGVAHGDLRRANIFWHPETGEARLIDFGAAWTLGDRPGWLKRLAFRLAARVDRATLEKLRRYYIGEDAPDSHYPWFLRWGRALRQGLYRPAKRFLSPESRERKRP
jgi:predicted Ser/Thr protein kinase